MMGPYYYYDTSFIEDVSTELHIHDCMWSGECYSCQPPGTRVAFSNGPVLHGATGTVPITVGGTGYITLSAPSHDPSKKFALTEKPLVKLEKVEEVAEPDGDCPAVVADTASPETASPSSTSYATASLEESREESQELQSERPPERLPREGVIRTSSKRTVSKGGHSTSDNKKLRHREVEKNRHRQLQAMVKTISERIPGRTDKETQVQTMKRAARYCVYLRNVLNSLPNGQSVMLKEKLEKIYLRSCDNVELIMAQNSSGR